MKKYLTLLGLCLSWNLSLNAFSDTYEHGDLIMGHFSFDAKQSSQQVAEIGKKLLKDDPNFNSMAVVGVGPHEWGLYFQYKKNEKIKTEEAFSSAYGEKIKKMGLGHTGHAFSDGIIILK